MEKAQGKGIVWCCSRSPDFIISIVISACFLPLSHPRTTNTHRTGIISSTTRPRTMDARGRRPVALVSILLLLVAATTQAFHHPTGKSLPPSLPYPCFLVGCSPPLYSNRSQRRLEQEKKRLSTLQPPPGAFLFILFLRPVALVTSAPARPSRRGAAVAALTLGSGGRQGFWQEEQ